MADINVEEMFPALAEERRVRDEALATVTAEVLRLERVLARVQKFANELATEEDDYESTTGHHLLFLLTPSDVLDKAGL